MKISAVSSGYRSLNFGRSLNKAEMDGAYKAAQEARNLMGFKDGNSLLIVPAGKLPQEQGQTLTQKLIDFFESVKKLLGINTVEITGMEQEGVKFGFYLYESVPEDQMETGYTLARDDQGNEYNLYNTASINSLPVYFSALFDQVNVLSTISYYADENQTTTIDVENCNVLRISDDGASCWMDNEVQEPGVYVETATPWTKNGMMNYSYEVAQSSTGADNSWITACNADESGWTTYYQNMLSFTATECPAGEGRWAVLNIVGRGVTSETPIILLQGTATLDDVYAGTGIENAVVDNSADKGFDENAPVYNLNGQRVSKSAKGILIQDGRKFIRK